MHLEIQRYRVRNFGLGLIVCMILGLILCVLPQISHKVIGPATNFKIAPYRYLVGILAGILALLPSRTDKGYPAVVLGSIAAFVASVILAYFEHYRQFDALVDLNLFLQGIILYHMIRIKVGINAWKKILQLPPRTLDLRIDDRKELFNRLVVAPHLELNPEILSAVDHFLQIALDYAPLSLCIHSAEPIAEHLQAVAREAFQMYYEDEERKIRKFIQSRDMRSVWMIVISIGAFRLMTYWSGTASSSTFWEILSSFAAFSLWKVGDTMFEHSEAFQRLARVLIAKNADIQFL